MRTFFWRASIGLSLLLALACKDGAGEPVCGNGIIEAGEACEDANTNSGDGCSSVCQVEAGVEVCNNNTDDDGDGLIDCADANCAADAACQGGGGAVGEPCAADAQCDNGNCIDELGLGFPSGYCSGVCDSADQNSCGADAVCLDVGFIDANNGTCLDLCDPAASDCRAGYECAPVQGVGGVCFPACSNDNQCPVVGFCQTDPNDVNVGFCATELVFANGCADGVDNDLDGAVDCADDECADNAACQNGADTLQTIDLGAVPTGQSRTFNIPAGALGFTILVEGDLGNTYAVDRLVKPNNTVLINNFDSGSIIQFPSEQAFGLVMPPNDIAVNAVTAGQWQVTIGSDFADSPNVKVLVRQGPFTGGLHDVKIYIPTGLLACDDASCNNGNGTTVTAANANTILEIQGMLNTYFAEFYADEGGLSQGNVQFFNINNNAFLDIASQAELETLFQQSSIGGAGGMHFYLVQTFSGAFDGVAGIASGIPGAMTTAGNKNSGVVVSIQADIDQNLNFTGLTMAHEGGHFMGLFHTTEFSGDPDLLSDTPACPAGTIGGNLNNCPDISFMMFPSLAPQMQNISNVQADVIQAGPLYR